MAAWDGFEAALNSERLWDPATGDVHRHPDRAQPLLRRPGDARATAGCAVFGGHEQAYEGIKDTNLYNPQTGTWTRGADMSVRALVPDGDRAAGRPRVRGLGRQHHAQRARA